MPVNPACDNKVWLSPFEVAICFSKTNPESPLWFDGLTCVKHGILEFCSWKTCKEWHWERKLKPTTLHWVRLILLLMMKRLIYPIAKRQGILFNCSIISKMRIFPNFAVFLDKLWQVSTIQDKKAWFTNVHLTEKTKLALNSTGNPKMVSKLKKWTRGNRSCRIEDIIHLMASFWSNILTSFWSQN